MKKSEKIELFEEGDRGRMTHVHEDIWDTECGASV